MKAFFLSMLTCLAVLLPQVAFGEPPKDITERIRKAEDDVRLAEATERRIAERLQRLQDDPHADPNALDAMKHYHQEVSALLDTHCQTLQELRSLLNNSPHAADPEVTRGMREFADAVGDLPEAEDPNSDLARMLAEFDDSLVQFDQMILDHFDSLRHAMDSRIAAGADHASPRARAAAEAAELLRQMGVDPEVSGNDSPETPADSSPPSTTDSVRGTTSDPRQPTESRRRDEDIVARQLREAAEQESDPELREKLWREYEAYLDDRS